MFKVLITGNGFDLYHALPTTYGNFMSILKKIETIKINEKTDLIPYKEIFGKGWKEIEVNYTTESIHFKNKKLKELQGYLKENIWYHYFKNILELDSWVDFEQEIAKALEAIQEFFEIAQNKFSENIISTRFSEDTYKSVFVFRKLKNLNIQKEENEGRFSFQSISSQAKKSYILNEKYFTLQSKNTFLNENKILEDLIKGLEELKLIFNYYYTFIIQEFYSAVKKGSLVENLVEKGLLNTINYFLTYNYSPTIEKLYHKDKVDYIHGRINESNSEQSIVLGINKLPESLLEYGIFDFTKDFQKLNQNVSFQFSSFIKARNLKTDDKITFYLFGISLDKSDEEHIKDLFKYLTEYNQSKLVIFYYKNHITGKSAKTLLLNNLLYINNNVVINLMTQDRLKFTELTLENIETEFLNE